MIVLIMIRHVFPVTGDHIHRSGCFSQPHKPRCNMRTSLRKVVLILIFAATFGFLYMMPRPHDKQLRTFHKYFANGQIPSEQVDLRVIVIVYDRANSLKLCLHSLNEVDYLGDQVALNIWIDRSKKTGEIDGDTYQVARDFNFTFGDVTIHNQSSHVGIIGQWLDSWQVTKDSNEIAVILEDDLTVGPHFWRWLKVSIE